MPALKNKKREQFCQEFVIDFNKTKAAERSGYSPKTARQQGCRLFTKADIRERISELHAEKVVKTGVTADRIIAELSKIAFADPATEYPFGEDGMKVTAAQKESALDKLAKINKMYTEDAPLNNGFFFDTDEDKEISINVRVKRADT